MEVRSFGLWPSPLAPGDLAAATRFRDVAWDSDDRTLVWLEGRGPQGILVCQQTGAAPRDFGVAVIPHTLETTTLSERRSGEPVNIEVDTVARYIQRLMTTPNPG